MRIVAALGAALAAAAAVSAATCVPPGGVQCSTPVTFSSISPNITYLDALGPIPPAWLFPYAPGACTLNPLAIPSELSDPAANFVQKYTAYCLAFEPCTPCYDAPRNPALTGEVAIEVPRDARLQKDFSTGWWYVVAQLYSGDDEKVDVIMSQSYTNPPKSGAAIIPASYKGDFLAQSSTSRVGVRSKSGVTTNQFAPGVTSAPWLAAYTAPDVNMTFRLKTGRIGSVGATYKIRGTTASGAVVDLVGRDVSGVILQGDRGYLAAAVPAAAEQFLAGTNYFSLRLDISGTVKLLDGVRKQVRGTSDLDFQWANGNPSPLNTATSWVWFNLRLPGKCNLFVNQMRQADGAMVVGARSSSYSLLNSPTLPSAGPGFPARHKQLPEVKFSTLQTWKSPTSNVTYPSVVVLTLGDYAEFMLLPDFVNGEMTTGPDDKDAFIEVGVRVVEMRGSAAYHADCKRRSDDDKEEVDIGVMEYQGFPLDTHPLKGLMEGGTYTSVSY